MAGSNEDVLRDALAHGLRAEYPALGAAPADVLRRPLDLADTAPAPPREPARPMSNGNDSYLNGQYRALETRVDDLRGNYAELRRDMDTRFSGLSAEIAKQAENTNIRLDQIVNSMGTNRGDFTKYAGVFAVIVAIASGIIGGFIKLENDSIGDKITTQGVNLAAAISTVDGKAAAGIADVNAKIAAAVPRPELDYKFASMSQDIATNRRLIEGIIATQNQHSTMIAAATTDATNLKTDVERSKGDIVTRRENESHWELTRATEEQMSAHVQQVENQLSARISDLRTTIDRALLGSPKYLVHPGESQTGN